MYSPVIDKPAPALIANLKPIPDSSAELKIDEFDCWTLPDALAGLCQGGWCAADMVVRRR